MRSRKKENSPENGVGVFNVLLIGENPHAISIADNIHSTFERGVDMKNSISFNIVDETPWENSWFNEFIFDLTSLANYNNVVVSSRFKEWNEGGKTDMERIYMKKLLQAMNFVIIDISKPEANVPTDRFGGGGGYETVFDYDIPQCRFNEDTDFLGDIMKWIDGNISKVAPKMPLVKIVRSLCGKGLPYLGDVFGCLSDKGYTSIIKTDKMRFDVPILFDEFCAIARGHDKEELEGAVITRSNSALASFFK